MLVKIACRERRIHVRRPGVPPGSATVVGRRPSAFRAQTGSKQLRLPRARLFPPPPLHTAESSPYPRVQPLNRRTSPGPCRLPTACRWPRIPAPSAPRRGRYDQVGTHSSLETHSQATCGTRSKPRARAWLSRLRPRRLRSWCCCRKSTSSSYRTWCVTRW